MLFFSSKNSKSDKIFLNEEGKTVSDENELCRTFCTYFANIVSDLQIQKIHEDLSNIRSNHDPVLAAINTFQNHPSVVNIKENLTRLLVLKTQIKVKSAKLLKTSMFAKLVKVVTFLQKP